MCFRKKKKKKEEDLAETFVDNTNKQKTSFTQPFLFEISRNLQSLFIIQALIFILLCFHSLTLLCLAGWNFHSDIFLGHWTHISHPFIEMIHTISNLIVFILFYWLLIQDEFLISSKHSEWLIIIQKKLHRFELCFSFLCIFDGTLLFYTDTIFLVVAAAVFILRYWQLHIVDNLSLSLSHSASSVLVEELFQHKKNDIPRILLKLFDLRKASIRISVFWSTTISLYNIAANLHWLASGSTTSISTTSIQQSLINHTDSLIAVSGFDNIYESVYNFSGNDFKIQTFLWHQEYVPDKSWWPDENVDEYSCLELPLVLPEPVSVENSIKTLGQCSDEGFLQASDLDFIYTQPSGLNLFGKLNQDFLGFTTNKIRECVVIPYMPSCHKPSVPCGTTSENLHSLYQAKLDQITYRSNWFWHVPLVNPKSVTYSEDQDIVWLSQNKKGVSQVISRFCYLGDSTLPTKVLSLPLGWTSLRFQYSTLQEQLRQQINLGVNQNSSFIQTKIYREKLISKAIEAVLQVPFLLHTLEANNYWHFCLHPETGCDLTKEHLSELDSLLFQLHKSQPNIHQPMTYNQCLQETHFWIYFRAALEIIERNTLEQDGLLQEDIDLAWIDQWKVQQLNNVNSCLYTKHTVLKQIITHFKAWALVMQRNEPQTLFRNWLLTLFFGAILLRKGCTSFLRYSIVPLYFARTQIRPHAKRKNVFYLSYFYTYKGEKTRSHLQLGEKTGSGALLLYTLYRYIWKGVILFAALVISISLLLVSLLTKKRNFETHWPSYAWYFNALLDKENFDGNVRNPGGFFFLLLLFSVMVGMFTYAVLSIFLKPLLFSRVMKKLKKNHYQHTKKEGKAVVWAMYLRTFAMYEGLVFYSLIFIGWIMQSFYASPWPWKYKPWFLLPAKAWNLALFVNCVYMPIVFVFGLHYIFECVVYESLFWSRALPQKRTYEDVSIKTQNEQASVISEFQIKNESTTDVSERKEAEEVGTALKMWSTENDSRALRIFFWAKQKEWIAPLTETAKEIISEAFLALLVINSFEDKQSGSKSLLLYQHGLLKKTMVEYNSLHKKLLDNRYKHLKYEIDINQEEDKRLHLLQKSEYKKLQTIFY